MRLPLPSLPGPSDLLDGATRVRDRLSVTLELLPRAAAAMASVETLLVRAGAAVGRVEKVVGAAEDTVRQGELLASAAAAAVERSTAIVEAAALVSRDAGRAVDGAQGVLDRVDAMLGQWEPTLRRLAPSAATFAESLDPREVRAAVSLVDRLPLVLDHLENDVLPMLRQLDRVGPDIHELLTVVEDLRSVVTGLPGIGLLRRRGDDSLPDGEDTVLARSRTQRGD